MLREVDTHEISLEPPAHWARQLLPLAALLAAVVVLVIAPFQALRWYRTPFVGALFEPNNVVSLIGRPDWAARQAGVDWPDRLIAVVGNVGTEELFNYTAIGDMVNLVKRLQEHAGPGQILLNQAARANVAGLVECRALAPVQFKGRAAFEPIFEVVGLKDQAASAAATLGSV